MRNITVLTVLVIILTSVSAVQAQETEKYALSATPRYGMFFGQAEEIVYTDGTTPYFMRSQLLWDIETFCYYGLELHYAQIDPFREWGFFSDLSLKSAAPSRSGSMADRDWRSVANTNLTDYSFHENYIDQIYLIDWNAGLSFPFRSMFLLKAKLVLSYIHLGFSGKNGYGVYAPSYGNGYFGDISEGYANPHFFYGNVISYSQDWLIGAAGASFGVKFLQNFFFEAGCNISPLIMCVALDFHITTQDQFNDYLLFGLYIEPHAALTYTLNKWLSISLDASYRTIVNTRGVDYVRNLGIGSDFASGGESGAGLRMLDTGLSLTVRF
ncbi:MAG: omptin family outer membrane protease [Treponema sp.]|nr:omptin family outer membrane protease [Treponema sp.]